MSTSENNHTSSDQQQTTVVTTKTVAVKKKPNRWLAKYILKHKMVFSLLFALVVVFVWAQCTIGKLRKEKEALVAATTVKLDSLNVENYKTLSDVFAWTLRTDLMRNNMEQAEQYLMNAIQLPYIKKAYIIDTEAKTTLRSTNPAENGLPVTDITLLQTKASAVRMNDSTFRFVSPVMGLSRYLGLSVLEADFGKR